MVAVMGSGKTTFTKTLADMDSRLCERLYFIEDTHELDLPCTLTMHICFTVGTSQPK